MTIFNCKIYFIPKWIIEIPILERKICADSRYIMFMDNIMMRIGV